MKKTLLLAAAALTALSSSADYSDYVRASIEGKIIEEGAVIDVNTYHDNDWWVDPDTGDKEHMAGGCVFVAEIDLVNLTNAEISTTLTTAYTDHPTEADVMADIYAWGTLQVCKKGSSCFPAPSTVDSKIPANGTITWQFDNNIMCPNPDNEDDHDTLALTQPNRKYKLTLTAEGETLSFFVNFQPKNTITGVAGISGSDLEIGVENGEIVVRGLEKDSAVEIYNLAGQVVGSYLASGMLSVNPGAGIYLVRVNDRVAKVAVR